MSEKKLESLLKFADRIYYQYGELVSVREGEDEETIVEYPQKEENAGMPGGIFRMLLSEFEGKKMSLITIGVQDYTTFYMVFREI